MREAVSQDHSAGAKSVVRADGRDFSTDLLRRLILAGLIEWTIGGERYRLTDEGVEIVAGRGQV